MRLVTYLVPGESMRRIGAIDGSEVVGLNLPHPEGQMDPMRQLIELWDGKSERTRPELSDDRHALSDVRLLAPITDPPGKRHLSREKLW